MKQEQLKAAVNESKCDSIQKLEVNDTINTTNVDNINETIKDMNDPYVNAKIMIINTELPKDKESKVTGESQTKLKVRNEKAEDCTLLKCFFVYREFPV